MGFEPTVGFPTLDFESSALNRTQPPFRDEKKNLEPAYAKSFGVASAERPTSNVQHKYDADDPVCEEAMVGYQLIALLVIALRVSPRAASALWQTGLSASRGKKCYNFSLAMSVQITASCVSTRTVTLLLVVHRYSQVLGAAVHQYAQLIRNLNPPSPP